MIKVSFIIRTKDEALSLPACLKAITEQNFESYEIIVVDSGSKDETLEVAKRANCIVLSISPQDFTFGRAINIGAQQATGEILVILSAHCLPIGKDWLNNLVQAFSSDDALVGVMGRQVTYLNASPIEKRGALEAFPTGGGLVVLKGERFSNAFSAVLKKVWQQIPFDETVSGAEDIDWVRKVQSLGLRIAYEPRSMVYHSHQETIKGVYHRFFRENEALILINSSFARRQNLLGYLLRYLRSVSLDYVFIISHWVSLGYFIKWFLLIPFFRAAVYYGQFKAQ